MAHQDAPYHLRRNIDHDSTGVLADPDFQSVLLIGLIGLLITACLTSTFALGDAISSTVLLG
jgi:hypothetical protein